MMFWLVLVMPASREGARTLSSRGRLGREEGSPARHAPPRSHRTAHTCVGIELRRDDALAAELEVGVDHVHTWQEGGRGGVGG